MDAAGKTLGAPRPILKNVKRRCKQRPTELDRFAKVPGLCIGIVGMKAVGRCYLINRNKPTTKLTAPPI